MDPKLRDRTAHWLAEAVATGVPLPPLPPEAVPRSLLDGHRIAVRVLEELGLVPCGLRVGQCGQRAVAGPMLDARRLRSGTVVALAGLQAPWARPAVVGVLAEPLVRRDDDPPVFASLHAAIDISGSRLRDGPGTMALAAADLAGLGFVLVGRARRMEPGRLRVSLGPPGQRAPSTAEDVAEALRAVALAARRAGGLPAGALLVAPLGPGLVPQPGVALAASLGKLGRVEVGFA